MSAAAPLTIRRVFLGEPGSRLACNVHATIGAARYEFSWLGVGHQVEVYDHPKAYRGGPRFVGYMPDDAGAKLITMARAAARRVSCSFYGSFEVAR
jgi:hypothetical protein